MTTLPPTSQPVASRTPTSVGTPTSTSTVPTTSGTKGSKPYPVFGVTVIVVLLLLIASALIHHMVQDLKRKALIAAPDEALGVADLARADPGSGPILLVKDGELQADFEKQTRASMDQLMSAITKEGGSGIADAKADVLLAGGSFVVELRSQ